MSEPIELTVECSVTATALAREVARMWREDLEHFVKELVTEMGLESEKSLRQFLDVVNEAAAEFLVE